MAAAGYQGPPGHFNLPLLANMGPIPSQITADYKQLVLEHYLQRKSDRPERYAIRNLLGLLAFRQGNTHKALQHFDHILFQDPENLNALANRAVASGEEMAAVTIGPDSTPEVMRIRQARSYAEQGFAFIFELYDETVTHERYTNARCLYRHAMDMAGYLVDHKEKEDWQFSIGLANYKIMANAQNNQEAKAAFQEATESFAAIVGSIADDAIKSEAWMHVALTFKKASSLRLVIDPANIPNLAAYIQKPDDCLQKAQDLSQDDASMARIRARRASFKNFEEAMRLLDESIHLDSSILNFHAYSTRARLRIKEYRNQISHNQLHLIRQAQHDLESILTQHVSPLDFGMLAEVNYHLARSTTGVESKEYITKALEKCEEALSCQDGASRPDIHKIHGKCLCFNGQHRQALEAFQQGVECEDKTRWICGNRKLRDEERMHIDEGE